MRTALGLCREETECSVRFQKPDEECKPGFRLGQLLGLARATGVASAAVPLGGSVVIECSVPRAWLVGYLKIKGIIGSENERLQEKNRICGFTDLPALGLPQQACSLCSCIGPVPRYNQLTNWVLCLPANLGSHREPTEKRTEHSLTVGFSHQKPAVFVLFSSTTRTPGRPSRSSEQLRCRFPGSATSFPSTGNPRWILRTHRNHQQS